VPKPGELDDGEGCWPCKWPSHIAVRDAENGNTANVKLTYVQYSGHCSCGLTPLLGEHVTGSVFAGICRRPAAQLKAGQLRVALSPTPPRLGRGSSRFPGLCRNLAIRRSRATRTTKVDAWFRSCSHQRRRPQEAVFLVRADWFTAAVQAAPAHQAENVPALGLIPVGTCGRGSFAA